MSSGLQHPEQMPSGPEAVLEGRREMREIISPSEQRSLVGQGGREVKEGSGDSGGVDLLKQEEKKELRQWALSELDLIKSR